MSIPLTPLKSKIQEEIINFFKLRYIEDPCHSLSTAFWKILKPFQDLNTEYIENQNKINFLMLHNDKNLLLYWQPVGSNSVLKINVATMDFFVIHERYLEFIPDFQKNKLQRYFRLVHYFDNIPVYHLPKTLYFQNVNLNKDISDICSLLSLCYPGSHFTENTIKSWTKTPVFNDNLWVWILDEFETKLALGIADFDKDINELSLEWIQVDPQFRHRGLGKALVCELLNRFSINAHFATVSGLCANTTNPEQLYRHCGFKGSDVWLVYDKTK